MWCLPIAVTVSALLDWSLFFLYQKKFHPWVGIIEEDNDGELDDDLSEDERLLEEVINIYERKYQN